MTDIRVTHNAVEQQLAHVFKDQGLQAGNRMLQGALEQDKLQAEDFSLRGLARSFLGEQWYTAFEQRMTGRGGTFPTVEAVDSTAFANVTGQLFFSALMKGFRNEAFISEQLMDRIPTQLNGEKIPGVAEQYDDRTKPVHEGMPFPVLGFGEDYIETPPTEKHGRIFPVTKEAVFFDRMGLVARKARTMGRDVLGMAKEERCLKVILGITNSFNWRGTAYDTYTADDTGWAAVGRGSGGNLLTGVELVDWTDIDEALQDRADILNPNTGKPVMLMENAILVMPAYRTTLDMILRATSVERGERSAAGVAVGAPNPFGGGKYMPYHSRLALQLQVAAGTAKATAEKYWFFGDFKSAFAYMENWGLQLLEAPKNSEAEFERDILLQYRVDERGVPAVLEPWAVTKITG